MDRREALREGLRGLSKMLPAMIGMAGGLGRLVGSSPRDEPNPRPACFPDRSRKARVDLGESKTGEVE